MNFAFDHKQIVTTRAEGENDDLSSFIIGYNMRNFYVKVGL